MLSAVWLASPSPEDLARPLTKAELAERERRAGGDRHCSIVANQAETGKCEHDARHEGQGAAEDVGHGQSDVDRGRLGGMDGLGYGPVGCESEQDLDAQERFWVDQANPNPPDLAKLYGT